MKAGQSESPSPSPCVPAAPYGFIARLKASAGALLAGSPVLLDGTRTCPGKELDGAGMGQGRAAGYWPQGHRARPARGTAVAEVQGPR